MFGNPTTGTGKVDTTVSYTEHNTTAGVNTSTPVETGIEADCYDMLGIRR